MSSQDPEIALRTPTVQMSFACENISTDPSGRLSFHNVIDSLLAPSFPASTATFFVIFSFFSQLPGFLVTPRVEIADENSVKVVEAQLQDMAFRPDAPNARAILGFPGIAWPHPGRYVVKFLANGDVKASFTINVQQFQPVPGGPTQQ